MGARVAESRAAAGRLGPHAPQVAQPSAADAGTSAKLLCQLIPIGANTCAKPRPSQPAML